MLAVAVAAAGVVVVVALADRTPDRNATAAPAPMPEGAAELPEAPAPAFSVPRPRRLAADEEHSLFAPLRRAAAARSRPDPAAPVVARLSTRTPEGTSSIVLVLERKKRAGRLWIRVRLPVLPNSTTGWVLRGALGGYGIVSTRLVVDLESLTATLFRNGRIVFERRSALERPGGPLRSVSSRFETS